MKNQYHLECNIAQTLNVIGEKWSLLILHEILLGNNTYKQLQETLEGIPTNLLSNRLKELEGNGLIKSKLYTQHPPRYCYVLTESGADLKDIFYSIMMWGEKYLDNKCFKELVHDTCSNKIEHQYYCQKCNCIVPETQIKVVKLKEGKK